MTNTQTVLVLDFSASCPQLGIVEKGGTAVAGVWPGVGAAMRSLHKIELAGGGRTMPQFHPMEAVYYVIKGEGGVRDDSAGTNGAIIEGSMIHVEPGTKYTFSAGRSGMDLIGGPCPADPALYRHLLSRGS